MAKKAIREAINRHPEWSASLRAWCKITENAEWKTFADVRNSWRNSDSVGKFVIFDVANNRCRLIATINYKWAMVYIRHILSHAEYERKGWEQ